MIARAALIMAGGRAARMGGVVKPLVSVCGRPLIEHALSLARAAAERVAVAVSPYTREGLRSYCSTTLCIETPGAGYPVDLEQASRAIDWRPILVLPSDLVGLTLRDLEALARARRAGPGRGVYTLLCNGRHVGVSLLAGGWDWVDVEAGCDPVNVNTWRDVLEAERRCGR